MTSARRAGVDRSVASPQQMNHQRLHRHDHHDHRREVDDEGVEVEADERADENVGRVADQRRRAPDIGSKHLGEQERVGWDVKLLGDRERHRHDQQHRRHVVEQRGYHGGGDLQQQKDAGGVRLRFLRRPDREIFEHPGAAGDRHQDHHAGEQPDRVPVDALEGLVLVQRTDHDHHRRAEQRHDRTIELVPDDDAVGDAQDDGRDHHRIEAEKDVRHEMLRRHAISPRMGRQARVSAAHCQYEGSAARCSWSSDAVMPFQSGDRHVEARECRRRQRSATTSSRPRRQ